MKFKMNELNWVIKEIDQSDFLSYNEDNENEYTFGETHFPTQEILICKELNEEQKKRTLLHELMHCYIGCYIATELENVDQEFICEVSANSHDIIHRIAEEYFQKTKEKKIKETVSRITSNKAKCLKCGDVIESKYRHDYVQCSCGNLSVDGGHDYCKRGFRDGEKSWVDLSEYVEEVKFDEPTF